MTFFFAVRKSPELKLLSTALARDPEGTSRLPRETFAQVFDRMERVNNGKQLEWCTIVEFFTKRGAPLTKQEIAKLVEEDRRQREEEEETRRLQLDQEKRRMQKLMDEIEQDEDFEAYQQRMNNQGGPGANAEKSHAQDDDSMDSLERHPHPGDEPDPQLAEGTLHARKRQSIGCITEEKMAATVSARDYGDRLTEREKGRYGVTVPKPFQFDLRDKVKPKTIRDLKVEAMVEEIKLAEQENCNKNFKSKPIPPEVLKPRFEAINTANERRREKVKQECLELTKKREAPFSFWEREKQRQQELKRADSETGLNIECKRSQFKANPIPKACSVLIYDRKNEEEEIKRQKRIHEKAEIAFAKASMPSRMKKEEDRKKQMPPKDLRE